MAHNTIEGKRRPPANGSGHWKSSRQLGRETDTFDGVCSTDIVQFLFVHRAVEDTMLDPDVHTMCLDYERDAK